MQCVTLAGMLLGYARIAPLDHNPALPLEAQYAALWEAGCGNLYSDTVAGASVKGPGLEACLAAARSGDILVVCYLDRMGGNLPHLITTVQALAARGVGFKSLQDEFDTNTPSGKCFLHVIAALADFERGLARERANTRSAAKRARGRSGGRKPALDAQQRDEALALYRDNGLSISEICRRLGVSRTTFYRSLPPHSLRPTLPLQPAISSTAASPTIASGPSPTSTVEMTGNVSRPVMGALSASPAALPSLSTPQRQQWQETQHSKPAWLTLASSKEEYAVLQLEAARRLLAFGPTPKERRSFEFRQARRELEGVIPVYSSETELMNWAQREVENADRAQRSHPLT